MKLDSIIKRFLPREERFQELLLKDTQNLTRSAELFLAIARSTKLEDRRIKLVELKALEHEGDEITRQVFEALNRSFITPLDREDIRSIAVDLDDILDYLEGIARYLVIFQIDEAPEPLTRFAEILLEMVGQIDSVTRLIWDLGNERARARQAGAHLGAREPGRRPLSHRHRRPLPCRQRPQRHGHHEVEGDLPESRGCLRFLQGLHPHHRQRGDQERLSPSR